jgi:hypothetical protein
LLELQHAESEGAEPDRRGTPGRSCPRDHHKSINRT